MARSTCDGCGAPIDIKNSVDGVVECAFCHRKITAPRSGSAEVVSFLAIGAHALDTGKFDEAYDAFKKASELDKNESEAYFGMALSEFKLGYIKDEISGRLQPICHEITDKTFTSNRNYLKAIGCASETQAEVYAERAEEIEYIRREFFGFKSAGLDYDCFICAKLTDSDGNRTKDYKTADDIYWYLKNNGFNPFFSEYEVKGRTGADYEALICYALYVSECMIVVCGNEEYLHTPWVKNEYMRFIELINDEQKERDAIAIAFIGKVVERLPGRSGKLQGIDMTSLGASDLVKKFVSNHAAGVKNRETAATRNADSNTVSAATISSLLTKAKQFLSSGSYNIARDYCNRVIGVDAENAEAWFLLLLAERHVQNIDRCVDAITAKIYSTSDIAALRESSAYKSAKMYSSGYSQFIALDNELTRLSDNYSVYDQECANRETAAADYNAYKKRVLVISFALIAIVGVVLFISTMLMGVFHDLYDIADSDFYEFFCDEPWGWVVMLTLFVVGIVGIIVTAIKLRKKK